MGSDVSPLPAGRAHIRLPVGPASALQARRFVADMLAVWDCDDPDQLAALLTSEVVTNAVRYAHRHVHVAVSAAHAVVRIATTDDDPRLPRLRRVPPGATSGRGLLLVDVLASRWGIDPHPPGKTVWFELFLPPRATATQT